MALKGNFKQSDVTRAIKGAQRAGIENPRVILHPSGTIEVLAGLPPAANDSHMDIELK